QAALTGSLDDRLPADKGQTGGAPTRVAWDATTRARDRWWRVRACRLHRRERRRAGDPNGCSGHPWGGTHRQHRRSRPISPDRGVHSTRCAMKMRVPGDARPPTELRQRAQGRDSMAKLRVVVADDHALMIAAVRLALESAGDIEVVG